MERILYEDIMNECVWNDELPMSIEVILKATSYVVTFSLFTCPFWLCVWTLINN